MTANQRIYAEDEDHRPARWWAGLVQFMMRHAWYTHPPVVLMIRATPNICLQTLTTASRPSTERLHHRNLFASGRRYYVEGRKGGFRMTTTSSVRWRYRKRTTSIAVMWGSFTRIDEDTTRIQLHARINTGFLLDTFLIPGGMTALLYSVPWPPLLIIAAIAVLLFLSWVAHRANALLESNEMVWFTQKALEDLVPAEMRQLQPSTVDMINDDFSEEWEKFYQEHKDV